MTGRKAIVGLCMLCALGLSAIAAQGAAAAGLTAFTCTSDAPTKQFSKEHCKPGETGTAFGHVAINEETHAELHNLKTNSTTTATTNSVLKGTIAATNVEITATGVKGTGALLNKMAGGFHEATGEGTIEFTGVTVTAPAGKGCTVTEDVLPGKTEGAVGIVKTNALKAKTVTNGAKHEVEIEPVTGTVLATFWITCTEILVPTAVQDTWEVTGKLKCLIEGATLSCSHEETTTQNTLKGKGSKVGLRSITTVTAGHFPVAEPTGPISATTIP